jgi:hypothetical protein
MPAPHVQPAPQLQWDLRNMQKSALAGEQEPHLDWRAQVLDVCSVVQPGYWELRELCVFLGQPGLMDASLALGRHVCSTSVRSDRLACPC